MNIQELAPFLQMVSVDVLALAFITFILTNIIKKFIPETLKHKIAIIPFVLGIIVSAIFSLIVDKNFDFLFIIKKGVQVGGVSTFIYAFIKQLLKKDTLEKHITKILNGILQGNTLKTAVKAILDSCSKDNEFTLNTDIVSKVIKENTNYSEDACKTISEIIINALNDK